MEFWKLYVSTHKLCYTHCVVEHWKAMHWLWKWQSKIKFWWKKIQFFPTFRPQPRKIKVKFKMVFTFSAVSDKKVKLTAWQACLPSPVLNTMCTCMAKWPWHIVLGMLPRTTWILLEHFNSVDFVISHSRAPCTILPCSTGRKHVKTTETSL